MPNSGADVRNPSPNYLDTVPRKYVVKPKHVDRELFAYAGLWETWSANGEKRATLTIITTDANDVVEPIHDRMLVMLEPEEEDLWLQSDDPAVLDELLDPYPDELTCAFPISKKVNDPAYEQPDVIEPIDIGEQSDLSNFNST